MYRKVEDAPRQAEDFELPLPRWGKLGESPKLSNFPYPLIPDSKRLSALRRWRWLE
jgi:hypothetical protein